MCVCSVVEQKKKKKVIEAHTVRIHTESAFGTCKVDAVHTTHNDRLPLFFYNANVSRNE